uniref:Pollen-specific leucine-rich repeat extensin-like protein 1 n=1 Tax=Cicer arietinum TaxID=3827 RepID=A0A1S3EJP6_CICAR|nr:pollen-specific leucine-rich repeat extensin-like protein 1 [Cicer arietinum]
MARIKMTVKHKKSCQEPEENQDVYSSTDSDCHEENQSEATSMNTISSSQPSKSSSPSITPKIVKKSSSSTPSRRSSRIMSGVVSTNKAPPQDNTIHVINYDDSETTPPVEPAQQPPPAKSNSKTSTPKKAKPSSPKPPSSSTKISENASLFDSAELETVYTSKWQNKSVVNGKIIDLADIKQGGFNMKIQNDDRPASKKRKTRPSSVSQNSEDETPHPPPEDTPSPLIPEPTSPLRNSPDTTPSPASPVPTTTQSTPIHKLTPLHEADPIPENASKSTSPQHMEDCEELYFDLNLSYPPSHTGVPMASPPTVPVDEDVILPPDFSQQIPPATNFEKTAQPLPEVTGVFSSLDSFFTATTHNQSKDKAGSSQNKSSSVNDQPKGSVPSTRIGETKKQMKLLKLIRKDHKKILQRFTHFQNSLVQFGLILEWVTKHLVATIAPGDHPPELPAQPISNVPSPSSSSDEPASSE